MCLPSIRRGLCSPVFIAHFSICQNITHSTATIIRDMVFIPTLNSRPLGLSDISMVDPKLWGLLINTIHSIPVAFSRGVHPPEPMKHSPPISEQYVQF